MKILVCPADQGGCGHYRLIWPARALAAKGHDVTIYDPLPGEKLFRGYYGMNDEPVGVEVETDCDVLVLQRPLRKELVELIPLIQGAGIAVVVEIDDDFTKIDPRNVAYEQVNSADAEYGQEWLVKACGLADLVTCSTPALARRFAPHGRVAVLENCVPQSYLEESTKRRFSGLQWHPGQKVRVGWAGAIGTHPGDLEATGGALEPIMSAGVAQFSVVGPGTGVREALGLSREPGKTGWVALDKYPARVAHLDVGIVPLKMSAFNRAKSWLKGLEMAACGVPFVASPTPEYERLAKLGAGRLAARPQDWAREVRALVTDTGYRTEQIVRCREVAKQWTVEGNCERWLAAWTEAYVGRLAA